MNPIAQHRAAVDFFLEHPGEALDESSDIMSLVEASGPQPNKKDLERIYILEKLLKEGNANGQFLPTVCKVEHFFAPGVYVRQMFIPAGVCTIGHIHRYPCVTIISYGDLIITTVNGRERYGAGSTFESPAGVKRAVYALADTLLTTIHGNPTDERDTDKVFASLIVDVYEKLSGKPTLELPGTTAK